MSKAIARARILTFHWGNSSGKTISVIGIAFSNAMATYLLPLPLSTPLDIRWERCFIAGSVPCVARTLTSNDVRKLAGELSVSSEVAIRGFTNTSD